MIYEFCCDKCEIIYEEARSYKRRHEISVCPECSGAAERIISTPSYAGLTTQYRDLTGQPIWFPKDGKPYFDVALRRTFNSPKEKFEYMRDNQIVMDGSESLKKYPLESGDVRNREYRKRMKMED